MSLINPLMISPASRVRATGGGRKRLADQVPGLLTQLQGLINDSTLGDPESPLLKGARAHKDGKLFVSVCLRESRGQPA